MAILDQIIQIDDDDDDEVAWEMEDSDYDSDDSEEDPTFDLVEKTQRLSINKERNRRAVKDLESDNGEHSDAEETSLGADSKSLDQVEEIIHSGQVEKLKIDQMKVYLRKHALRLTGKKDVLVQRIKEHLEIVKGRGEEKYPRSSFVLNCKGDACKGDVVMFEQIVDKRSKSNIASKNATAPPCTKRIVAGRIVKESYGSAKQQHTFTIEVLWSKGEKPLPPLHPLLIKGRNLYKLNTMRQRWEDEDERCKVLDEKHSRGSIARSNREARKQKKAAQNMLKANRAFIKDRQKSSQHVNSTLVSGAKNKYLDGQQHGSLPKTNQQQASQGYDTSFHEGDSQQFQQNEIVNQSLNNYSKENIAVFDFTHQKNNTHVKPQFPVYKENSCPRSPFQLLNPKVQSFHHRYQGHFSQHHQYHHMRAMPTYLHSTMNQGPISQHHQYHHMKQTKPTYLHTKMKDTASSQSFQNQCQQTAYGYGGADVQILHKGDDHWKPLEGDSMSRYHKHPESRPRLQPCQYYPKGRCYYGTRCKFLHE